MTTNRRILYFGAGAGALVLAGVLAFAAVRGEENAAPGQSMDGRTDMDMGGMGSDGSIRLSAAEIRTFGITFGTAEVRPLRRTIRTVGMVEFDETKMAYVAPKFGGWVERLHVDFTGQPVRKGQPLLEVYSPELVSAQEELLLAARMAESVGESGVEGVASGARDLLESARRRLRYWDISDAQIRRVLDTGSVSRTLTLYAPATGIVVEKDVFEGQAFQPGRNLYMIADLAGVWVNAEVFEADAAAVRQGMPVTVEIAALPGRPLRGKVEYVYPTLGEKTRSMRARIALPNPGGSLKPGMYATVLFEADLGRTLTVPASAVLHSGERAVAFADMGGGELMPHELKLGAQAEEYVQVLEGIEPGQRVVTSAQFLLDSESNLAEVMKAMMAQMNMSDMGSMDMGGMEGMNVPDGEMKGMDAPAGEMEGMDMPGMDGSKVPQRKKEN